VALGQKHALQLQNAMKCGLLGYMEAQSPTHNTQRRQRYEKQADEIRSRYGSLEDMRLKLGLSKRQLAEYLLVDPATLTRWTTGASDSVPLHVYKTMSYLMADFAEAKPAEQVFKLKKQLEQQEVLGLGWKFLIILNGLGLLYLIIS